VSRRHRPLFRAGLALVATALLGALPVVTPTPLLAEATSAPVSGTPGYWLVGGDGSVYPFGSASDRGSLRGKPLSRPVVGMAATPSGAGYWMVGSDGGIFSFGDAGFHGSTGALKLNQPIVGMAATPSGKGYWFVASDGGIFSFGDAAFHGSTGAIKLNKPIVGMAPTATGKGYWFVASDGGIFSFGDAAFYGSTGAMKLAKPITGMAASPSGKGYWFVASDGGIFNFGDAAFLGSAGGTALPAGIVVMSAGLLPSPGTIPTNPTTPTTGPGPSTTATTGPPPTGAAFEIGLVGDSGYASSQYATFDRVVAHMNSFPLSFVVHDGDFKDPQTACTDNRFNEVKTSFNKSKAPFVYVAGDNEWMDCSKNAANPMDPVERLGKLRELFFAQDQSLGQSPMPLTTQRQQGYPENTRWTKEGVVFVTLNAPGPSDNLDYDIDHPGSPEAGPRRMHNIKWLREAFQHAEAINAAGVMVVWQVDPWVPKFRRTWDYLMDWQDDAAVPDSVGPELKQLTVGFGRPVVLVHGDTHVFRIDKGGYAPPDSTDMTGGPWTDVPNFTRVMTYAGGSFSSTMPEAHPDMWIRVAVDPKSPQVFTFTSQQAP
jgi:ribosomal protein L24E